MCWAAQQGGMASAGLGKGWGACGLTHTADAPLSTSGSCNNLGREENAPMRAHTPVKCLCAIPQKCLIPNLRVAALMNSRRCFECQTHFSCCCRRCPSPHPCAGAGGRQGGTAGLGDPCGLDARAARLGGLKLDGGFQGTTAQ